MTTNCASEQEIFLCGKCVHESTEKMIKFSEKHREFSCAVTQLRFGESTSAWIPMLFVRMQSQMVRVVTENAICSKCGWKGIIANPDLPWLFDGHPNRFEEIKLASKLQSVPCPHCGATLSRHAIWAGEYD